MSEAPEKMSVANFMDALKNHDKTPYKDFMTHIMTEFGTSLHCNRFGVGNCNEYAIADLIEGLGYPLKRHQNAKRIDIEVNNFRKFSIKYSGGGNIKLHNSNNQTNTDMKMCDTLLVNPKGWWFLSPSDIEELGIPLKDYLNNTGDGLELKASIFPRLKEKKYPHFFDFDISVDKSQCKNKEINRIIYDALKSKRAEPTTPSEPKEETPASPAPETSPSS
jgi:hypothetical protein